MPEAEEQTVTNPSGEVVASEDPVVPEEPLAEYLHMAERTNGNHGERGENDEIPVTHGGEVLGETGSALGWTEEPRDGVLPMEVLGG